jgi:hypothetical protein
MIYGENGKRDENLHPVVVKGEEGCGEAARERRAPYHPIRTLINCVDSAPVAALTAAKLPAKRSPPSFAVA